MLACQRPPKRRREPVKTYPCGREICDTSTAAGLREYKRRTKEMYLRQHGLCSICKISMRVEEAQFEHAEGRGMNGSHRDDRIEIEGRPFNSVACWKCNTDKASMRMDAYMSRLGREVR